MKITIIAAMTKNKVIGANNDLPWHIPKEFAHFKKMTMGKPLVMGKRSFESLQPHGLPGRDIIVLSTKMKKGVGYKLARNIQEALALGAYAEELMIGGGSAVYEQFIPLADEMILSTIHRNYLGDTYFPEFNLSDWKVVNQETHDAFTVQYFERVRPAVEPPQTSQS